MSISIPTRTNTSRARRTTTRILLIGAIAIGGVLVPSSGQAREAERAPALASLYGTPIDALGGLTLSQYVANHQAHAVGFVGV